MGTIAGLAAFNETVSHFSEHPPANLIQPLGRALPENSKEMQVGGYEQ